MKVNIENNLYLESDGMGFTIKKYGAPYVNGKGERVEPSTSLGHYSSVSNAIGGLVRMKVMESTATTLKELLESVEGIEQWIKQKVGV